jgi:hypothetical protein
MSANDRLSVSLAGFIPFAQREIDPAHIRLDIIRIKPRDGRKSAVCGSAGEEPALLLLLLLLPPPNPK